MLGIAWFREESTTVKGGCWLYSILLFNKCETLETLWEPWTLPPSHQWERLIAVSTQERTYEDRLSKIQRHWISHPKWVLYTCWQFVLYCITDGRQPKFESFLLGITCTILGQLKNSSKGAFTIMCRVVMPCCKMGWVMCLVFSISKENCKNTREASCLGISHCMYTASSFWSELSTNTCTLCTFWYLTEFSFKMHWSHTELSGGSDCQILLIILYWQSNRKLLVFGPQSDWSFLK